MMSPHSPNRSPRGPSSSLNFGRSRRNQQQSFPNAQSRGIEREEERLREQLNMEFNLESSALDSTSFHYSTASFRKTVETMNEQMQKMSVENDRNHKAQLGVMGSLDGVTGQVQSLGHILGVLADVHTESVKSQMMDLRVQNATLEKRCEDLRYELELERSQVSSLKHTLRGHIARSRDQMEEVRDIVREQVAAEALDVQALKRDLQYRCDAAAAAVNVTGKPLPQAENFDSRLKKLEEGVEEANRLIEARFHALRHQLNTIRVSDEAAEATSLHSNIPSVFRAALMQFSNDELINLLDTLSFTPGVCSEISSAVCAKHSVTSTAASGGGGSADRR